MFRVLSGPDASWPLLAVERLAHPAMTLVMARRKIIHPHEYPFHIGNRCINRDWFSLPMPEVWDTMKDQLHFLASAFDFKIYAFVLMTNHFHLIASAPKGNLSEGMAFFLRETSRALVKSSHRINQTWGGRFFRCALTTNHYYYNCYKYVYRNPVASGLADKVEEYPYSTLHGLLGGEQMIVPMAEDLTLFSDLLGTLDWLNREPDLDHWKAFETALTRPTLRFPNARKHFLESNLL